MHYLLTVSLLFTLLTAQAQQFPADSSLFVIEGRANPSFSRGNGSFTLNSKKAGTVTRLVFWQGAKFINGTLLAPDANGNASLPVGYSSVAALSAAGIDNRTTNDGRYFLQSSTVPFAKISATPTTRAGYGITDAEPTITSGTSSQFLRGDKTFVTLTPAIVGLGNVPNTDATLRANHTGTQPVATVTGAVSLVQGITPTNGAVTIPQATTANDGVLSAAQVVRYNAAGITATVTISGLSNGATVTHNLANKYTSLSSSVIYYGFFFPTGSKIPDQYVTFSPTDGNTGTLNVPGGETATGSLLILTSN